MKMEIAPLTSLRIFACLLWTYSLPTFLSTHFQIFRASSNCPPWTCASIPTIALAAAEETDVQLHLKTALPNEYQWDREAIGVPSNLLYLTIWFTRVTAIWCWLQCMNHSGLIAINLLPGEACIVTKTSWRNHRTKMKLKHYILVHYITVPCDIRKVINIKITCCGETSWK